ncbi:hypothetical protein N7462_005448 [Penicillium macrosclerotiorum]|uniref:uncharacterized protein n=1 Tax=Penicillium macrosclerotiorum TaxID=303699 RepID=UPI002546F958|nr:uncharacterized protein N7462_005448 [Penicillium macrosclerotiorum]KAJ5682283.1 hypothetical protein N7462_005448 [Penicillium macrosclerotiorum]
MHLLDFPTELLENIAQHLESQADINALLRSSQRLYSILNAYLYSVNARVFTGSALLWAVQYEQLQTADYALRYGVQDLIDWDREPLHCATETANERFVELLLRYEAGVDCKRLNKTPLYVAAGKGYEGVARLLLHHGADLESNNFEGNLFRYNTPLHIAAYHGHVGIVKLFLEQGANIETENSNESTPLLQALYGSQPATFWLLLNHNASIEGYEVPETILHTAALEGNVEIVRGLLERGVGPNLKDRTGTSPLTDAALQGCHEVVRLLVESGVNLESREEDGSTALSICASFGHETAALILLDCGADPNTKDSHGNTPLHKAVIHDQSSISRALIERGAHPDVENGSGETPIFRAVEHGKEENVRILLQHGCNREAKRADGITLLHLAKQYDNNVLMAILQNE